MAANQFVQLPLDGQGKKLDAGPSVITDAAANQLVRQVGQIGDPALLAGIANVKPPSASPAFTVDGSLVVSVRDTAALAAAATTVIASNFLLKAGAGALYSLNCCPSDNGYVMLFDALAAPPNGVVRPAWVMPCQSTSGSWWEFPVPLLFQNGILAVFSSSGPFSLTLSVSAFLSGQVQ